MAHLDRLLPSFGKKTDKNLQLIFVIHAITEKVEKFFILEDGENFVTVSIIFSSRVYL